MNQNCKFAIIIICLKLNKEVNLENKILAICDTETTYAELLTKQLLRLKGNDLEIRKFSNLEKLKEFGRDKLITYLLVSEEYREKVGEIEALSYYFLTNGKTEEKDEHIDSENLYRYQAVKDIYATVVGEQRLQLGVDEPGGINIATEIIGLFNPVRRNGQTTFARALAKELGRKKYKVLYINLDEIGVPVDKLRDSEKHVDGKGNISDIIYYLKQDSEQLPELIKRTTYQGKKFDFIAPPPIFTELQSVTLPEWILLIDFLKKGDYQKIILDLDSRVQGFTDILDKCDRVFIPSVKGRESHEKSDAFYKGLRVLGKNKLLIKMQTVMIPEFGDDIELSVGSFLRSEQIVD